MKMLIVVFSILMSNMSFAQMKCEQVLSRSNLSVEIMTAINNSIANLAELRLNLEKQKIAGVDSIATRELENNYLQKLNKILRYIEQNKIMNRDQLLEKMHQEISKLQLLDFNREKDAEEKRKQQQKSAQDAIDDITRTSQKMILHDIKPGIFNRGVDKKVKVEIEKTFAMMSTPVTQLMWAWLKIAMGETDPAKISPSSFKMGPDAKQFKIQNIEFVLQPDHPVECVSWYEIKDFIRRLNRLSKWGDEKAQLLLETLIPEHKKGDIYDLPTVAQWEFVMTNRGKANKKYFNRDDDSELEKYAWYVKNSGNRTQNVATRLPRMVDGQPFYDLEGNVREWSKDWYQGENKFPGLILLGGSWGSHAAELRTGNSSYYFSPGHAAQGFGFRLIRTRP